MAKVTITIEDSGAGDGGVRVGFDFDPPLRKDRDTTPAQGAALLCMDAMRADADEQGFVDERYYGPDGELV